VPKPNALPPVIFFLAALILLLAACKATPAAATPTPPPSPPPASGEIDDLEPYWREQANSQPENPEALYQLALVLTITAPEEAGEVLDQLEALSRDYTQPINRMRAALRRSLAVKDRAYQLTQAGQALASLEEWPLAEQALQLAVAEDPEYAEAWAYLGEVRYHTGSDGLEALQTALALSPDSYAVNIFLGLYWRRSGLPDNALPYLKKASEIDPTNLALLEDLANTMIHAGQIKEAVETVNKVVEANPEDSQTWAILARISIENDIQVESIGIPAARKVVVLTPGEADPMILLGRGYLLIGNTQLAERFFSQASLAAPDLPEPHYYLGLLYFNLFDYDAAQTHLLTAIDLAEQNGDSSVQAQAERLLDRISP